MKKQSLGSKLKFSKYSLTDLNVSQLSKINGGSSTTIAGTTSLVLIEIEKQLK